jgi:pimeloyl-ACP methyl ester carboxylesterase
MLPIVLIHGFPLDSSMWREQAAFLRGRGFETIVPDLPGFGERGRDWKDEPGDLSMEGLAEFVLDVIEREAGGRAIVGGLSMGGYILLALLRAHPACAAGVMLMDTRAEADTPEGRAGRMKSIEEIRKSGIGSLVESLMGRLVSNNAAEGVKRELRAMMERQVPETVMAAQAAMARRRDQTNVLATLKMPALIVVGEEDAVTPVSAAQAMHGNITAGGGSSTLVRIAGAGHMSPMEAPAAVNEAVAAFAARVQ